MSHFVLAFPKIGDLLKGLKSHKRRIATYALMGSFVFALYGLATPRLYQATSQVLLTTKANGAGANATLIEGQKRLFTSQIFLQTLVEREKLSIDKEFGLKDTGFISQFIEALVSKKAQTAQERAIALLEKAIVVRQSEAQTLDIHVKSLEAGKALRLTQSLTQIYLEQQFGLGDTTNRAFAARFATRLEELSVNLRQAEERLYRLKNDVRKTNSDDDLSFQSNQLAIARAKTAELRERVEKFIKFQRTGGDVALMIQALNSPRLETMRQTTLDLMKQEGELLQTLLPKHPQVLAIQKQINDSKLALSNEVARGGNALKADLEAIYETEKAIASKVESLRHATSGLSAPTSALREAEREVETQKALYTSLLLRSNDTRESLDPLQVNLITPAKLPLTLQGFSLAFYAGLGLLLGAIVGALHTLGLSNAPSLLTRLGLTDFKMAQAKVLSFTSFESNSLYASKMLAQAKDTARSGENCLLIEADKNLELSQLILNQPQAGLSEWLRGEKTLDEVVVYDTNTGLCFLPYGLSELTHTLTPIHVARLKLFSSIHISAGKGEDLEAFNLLNAQHVLFIEANKNQVNLLEAKKIELQTKGVQLNYGFSL